jgi:hypothetical protein
LLSSDGVGGVSNSYSSFVPSAWTENISVISMQYQVIPEILAERIRIQNLRFAYLLCAAQRMSMTLKI